MKKSSIAFLLFVALSIGLSGNVKAQEQTIEVSIDRYGTPTTISVSTSAWTKAAATTPLQRRTGIIVDEPASNNANMVGHLGNCTSTSVATSIRPIEIVKGEMDRTFQIDDNVCLWLLSLHTAAENVHIQEISKRN